MTIQSSSATPSPGPARVKEQGPFPAPPTAPWQEKFAFALTTELPAAVAACAKAKGTTFYPMPLASARTLAREIIQPKALMVDRHLDPSRLEVVETPEGRLLCLNCELIGHTPTPFPMNERFMDAIQFSDRPRVSPHSNHAALHVVIPKGKTLEQVLETGNSKLEALDRERDYQLREDLQEYGQLSPGLSIAVAFAFDGDSEMDQGFREQQAAIDAEIDPILKADRQKRLDDAKGFFQAHLGTICQFAGNNRAMHVRKCYETKDHHYYTGFQERAYDRDGSSLNLDRAFRQFSGFLNHAHQTPDHPRHDFANSLVKLAKVPTRVVVGVENPTRFLASLRSINNREHGRPPLQFKDGPKARSQGKEVIAFFAASGLITKILARAPRSPLHALLAIKGGADLLEPVLTGDQHWSSVTRLLDANGVKTDLLDVEMALTDLLRAIFLPDFQEGKACLRTTLLEPARSDLMAIHVQKRMNVMMAAIAGLLGLEINDRVMDGIVPVSVIRDGLAYPTRSIATHLSVAQHDASEAKELWRWRLLPYLAGTGMVRADVGSMQNRDTTYLTPDGKPVETQLVRRTPSDALQTLLHSEAKVFANRLAENIVDARKAYLEKGEPFVVQAFQVTYDTLPLPVAADKAWFDRVFKKQSRSGRVVAPGLVDAIDPLEQLVRGRQGYQNCLDDVTRDVLVVLEALRPPCLNNLTSATNALEASARALANAQGRQVYPLSEEEANDLVRTVSETWNQIQTVAFPAFRERFKVFREDLNALMIQASQIVHPDALGQGGAAQEVPLGMEMDL